HTAVSGILPPALKVLRGRLPDLSLELGTGLTHELEAHVRRRRIDAAIISEPEVIAADMRFTPFVTERLVVIAPENCPGKTHEEVLTSQPYIRFNRAARVGRMIERHLANREIKVRTKMEIDTLEGVLALVANGLGVTVAPDVRAVHPFPTNLRVLPFGDEMASRTLGLLELSDNPRTRFVERLLEALQEVSAPSSTPAAVSA
ncbi:MAG: LysR substrate-binding domain-containing protein, partial [Pseudomonadota bacterium]